MRVYRGLNMSEFSKMTISFYDGKTNGVRECVLDTASLTAYVVPREYFSDAKGLATEYKWNKYGVYFLVREEEGVIKQIYVGQTMQGIGRLESHYKNKKFWNKAFLFLGNKSPYSLDVIKELEAYAISELLKLNRYDVENQQGRNIIETNSKLIRESYQNIKFIMVSFGYDFTKKIENKVKDRTLSGTIKKNIQIPSLPSGDMKVGKFIQTAMKNLSEAGYVFTKEMLENACSKEWSSQNIKTYMPFLRLVTGVETPINDESGRQRYYKNVYSFGKIKVLLTKELREKNRDYFIKWYALLK
jgi:hypothetical protein